MMKPIVLIATLFAVGVTGCVNKENRVTYDGQYFRTKVSKVEKQRDIFVVTVKDPGKSFEGARASAHHVATAYCVSNFGTSEIIWVVDPLNKEVPLRIEGKELSFQGKCPQAQRI